MAFDQAAFRELIDTITAEDNGISSALLIATLNYPDNAVPILLESDRVIPELTDCLDTEDESELASIKLDLLTTLFKYSNPLHDKLTALITPENIRKIVQLIDTRYTLRFRAHATALLTLMLDHERGLAVQPGFSACLDDSRLIARLGRGLRKSYSDDGIASLAEDELIPTRIMFVDLILILAEKKAARDMIVETGLLRPLICTLHDDADDVLGRGLLLLQLFLHDEDNAISTRAELVRHEGNDNIHQLFFHLDSPKLTIRRSAFSLLTLLLKWEKRHEHTDVARHIVTDSERVLPLLVAPLTDDEEDYASEAKQQIRHAALCALATYCQHTPDIPASAKAQLRLAVPGLFRSLTEAESGNFTKQSIIIATLCVIANDNTRQFVDADAIRVLLPKLRHTITDGLPAHAMLAEAILHILHQLCMSGPEVRAHFIREGGIGILELAAARHDAATLRVQATGMLASFRFEMQMHAARQHDGVASQAAVIGAIGAMVREADRLAHEGALPGAAAPAVPPGLRAIIEHYSADGKEEAKRDDDDFQPG